MKTPASHTQRGICPPPPEPDPKRAARATLVLLLSLVFLAVFSGCSRQTPPAADAKAPVTLEFWDFPHLPVTNNYIMDTVAAFERENPGVRIRYTKLPWQDGQQKVMLSVNSANPPDICGQVGVSTSFIAQDVLEPMNAYLAPVLADFHKSYIDSVSYRGTIYAVPWYKACYVMLLNLDVFDRLGVAPPKDGRWTWDEFVSALKALTKYETPDGKLHDGTPPPRALVNCRQYWGLSTNLGPMEYEAYTVIFNAGGRVLTERPDGRIESTLTEPPFIEGLRRLASLEFEHHVAMPGIGAMTQEQSWGVWRDSRAVAVTIQGAWCVTAVKRYNEDLERTNERKRAEGRAGEVTRPIRWAVVSPPCDRETTPVLGSTGLGTYVVFRQKDARKRDLAAKFVLQLTGGRGQQVLKEENVYPSRISAGNPFAADPMLGPVFALFPDGILSPLLPGGERVDKMLQQEIQRAVLRDPASGRPQATPEQAARDADAKVRAIIARAQRRFGAPK